MQEEFVKLAKVVDSLADSVGGLTNIITFLMDEHKALKDRLAGISELNNDLNERLQKLEKGLTIDFGGEK